MEYNTCRLCHDWKVDLRHTGPMLKYSTRHYAHAKCGCVRWGREWLNKQPDWVIAHLPWFFAQDMGIADVVRAAYERNRAAIQEVEQVTEYIRSQADKKESK